MPELRKPVTVIRAEFIQNLTDLINTCGLPPFIIEPVLKDMYRDVAMAAQRQIEQDRKAYQDALNARAQNDGAGK